MRPFSPGPCAGIEKAPDDEGSPEDRVPRIEAAESWQGARQLRPGGLPADRLDRSNLRLRSHPPERHPGQGEGPEPDLDLLVRDDGRAGPKSSEGAQGGAVSRTPGAARRGPWRSLGRRETSRDAADRVRGARLPGRV